VSETGLRPGDLTGRTALTARLVSVFCVPPTYNGLVDGSADLPGPGAVCLFGASQLVD
jgi:hypothetical protein